MQKKIFFLSLALIAGLSLFSCTKKEEPSVPVDPAEALWKRGRQSYQVSCTACHHPDPSKDGALGPAVAGSGFDLLRARLMEGGYPPGYQPKRTTKAMAAMPHLKDQIEALQAYLAKP